MAKVQGLNFLLYVNTGTDGSPVYTLVAGQKNATLNLNTDEIDTTNKDSANWHEGLASIRNWSVDFDGLVEEADAGFLKLEQMFFTPSTNQPLKIRVQTPSGARYEGKANLTDWNYEAAHDDAVAFSGTLVGTSTLTKV